VSSDQGADEPDLCLFTIGHSTHPLDEFLSLLSRHGVRFLADIRRHPGSRTYPQYGRDALAASLAGAGIEDRWAEALGGRRRKPKGHVSENTGLRNESFRSYADYMLTPEFREAVGDLLSSARAKRTVYMCSESVFWRCHRRLVSDFLTANGITVRHVMPNGDLRPHVLTPGAVIETGTVRYPTSANDA
jgi:uncharacterized protein (DUF488 family)